MNRFLSILFLAVSPFFVYSQKVALVFSGGGAKGLAHLGVLKALENNGIPIDCIVGTSMGGIVGGCYASGMSPDQIEEMVLSEGFLRWINGQSERGYNYFYHQSEDNASFLKLNLALDSTFSFQLNTTLASDVSLNFALAEKMAQASAISKNNFDSLFIPFRVVASDIFTQNQIILSKGSLTDALRATQTVPFFYTPIRVDGKYLFDGGIYNNFPVDVADREFHPDVVIGSNVSTKIYEEYPFNNDEKLISNSLLFMLLDKSSPGDITEKGIYIQPNLNTYSAFDFSKARSLIDSGYAQTMRQMDDIKKKIKEVRTCEVVMQKRNSFNNKSFPMVFEGLSFKGYNANQRRYIKRLFRINPKNTNPIYFNQIKRDYFRLVSESYFGNAYPNIIFDHDKRKFQLQLTRRPQKNFEVDFGGVIATRDISNIFLGFNYYDFGNGLLHVYAGFQTGSFYKSALIKARIDFPYQFYLEPEVLFNGFNYINSNDLLQDRVPTILKRLDRRVGLTLGVPIGSKYKSSLGIKAINNLDRYGNNDIFISTDTLDELRLTGYKTSFEISRSNLNRKQYPSDGGAFSLTANYFDVMESYLSGNTSLQNEKIKNGHQWLRVKLKAEQYFKIGWFSLGYNVEGVFSNQPFFQNYFGTIINASAFLPLQDSRSLILENFRAFNYVAVGIRNVISLRKRLDLRLEGHFFKPLEYLQKDANQKTVSTSDLRNIFFASTAGFVMHSPIGPISLSVNYYDDKQNQFGVLLHVGYLLFNKHAFDQ